MQKYIDLLANSDDLHSTCSEISKMRKPVSWYKDLLLSCIEQQHYKPITYILSSLSTTKFNRLLKSESCFVYRLLDSLCHCDKTYREWLIHYVLRRRHDIVAEVLDGFSSNYFSHSLMLLTIHTVVSGMAFSPVRVKTYCRKVAELRDWDIKVSCRDWYVLFSFLDTKCWYYLFNKFYNKPVFVKTMQLYVDIKPTDYLDL